jgi:hypothetical protein
MGNELTKRDVLNRAVELFPGCVHVELDFIAHSRWISNRNGVWYEDTDATGRYEMRVIFQHANYLVCEGARLADLCADMKRIARSRKRGSRCTKTGK